MKAILSVVGVVGLAAVLGLFEPAAAAAPVSATDVRVLSEQLTEPADDAAGRGKFAKTRKDFPRRGQ